jgi:hypothetical protein
MTRSELIAKFKYFTKKIEYRRRDRELRFLCEQDNPYPVLFRLVIKSIVDDRNEIHPTTIRVDFSESLTEEIFSTFTFDNFLRWVWAAITNWERHEQQECFYVHGKRIYDPHKV